MYKVIYTEKAKEDLQSIERQIAQRILKKITFFATQKNPLYFAKPLKNMGQERYRFRIGDYRAIFRIDQHGTMQFLMILRIKYRKDIYGL